MTRKLPKTAPIKGEPPLQPFDVVGDTPGAARVDLAAALETKARYGVFSIWIIGLRPLIVHAWSQKAKREMLQGQTKAVRGEGKPKREPQKDFTDSIYRMGKDKQGRERYGFPATGIKKSLLTGAHMDKGIAKTIALSSLWIDAPLFPVTTTVPGAICDLPLVRIWGDEPEMREDTVRVGTGITKKSTLAFRAQFRRWAINVRGRFNLATMDEKKLAFLIGEAGLACGVGEWRNEKSGVFGSYRMANPEEEKAWFRYAAGKGPLPEIEDEHVVDDDEYYARMAAE
jgi:hypothetical protein